MSLLFKFQIEDFRTQVGRLVNVTGKDASEVVKQEAKLFVQDAMRMTPPFSTGPSTEALNLQRKTGEAAVERDIKKLFALVKDVKIRDRRIKKDLERAIRKRDFARIKIILKYVKIPVQDVTQMADPAAHQAKRDRRGRIQRNKQKIWVLNEPSLNRLIREKKKHVGKAKSGWTTAARALGVRMPGWVTRHTQPGLFKNNLAHPKRPSVTVGNLVGYIQESGNNLRIMQRALANRTRNIKAKLEKIIASGWKKKAGK